MQVSDAIGSTAVLAFGLWWLIFPASVIRFYSHFGRWGATMPGPTGVRIAGAAWLVFASFILWMTVLP